MKRWKRYAQHNEEGLFVQTCRECLQDKLVEQDFRVKHPHLEEPYCRDTICIECRKPIEREWGKKRRDRLRKMGLNDHYKPFHPRLKQHIWVAKNTLALHKQKSAA